MAALLRYALALAAGFALVAALSGCGSTSGARVFQARTPAAVTDQCPAVASLVQAAPASADDPATGTWLGRLDKIRDTAKASADDGLAFDLDYAGALVALKGFPPQAAIATARLDCATARTALSVPAAPVRAWLQANPAPVRAGMVTGVVTQVAPVADTTMAPDGSCPSASHGSDVARAGPCIAWTVALTTATGTVRASCGNVADEAACSAIDPAGDGSTYLPGVGDELQVPVSGHVSRLADLVIIDAPGWGAGS